MEGSQTPLPQQPALETPQNTDNYMGGCQNSGPFWGPLLYYGTYYLGYPQKETLILTTAHIYPTSPNPKSEAPEAL